MEIKITGGKIALIDAADYPLVANYSWCLRGYAPYQYAYAYAGGGRKNMRHVSMHRLIAGAAPGEVVDHINRNRLDNRRSNLRICTQRQNLCNADRKRKNIYRGVKRNAECSTWSSKIRVFGKQVHLGCFKTSEEAALAYDIAARKYHGEFAFTNGFA